MMQNASTGTNAAHTINLIKWPDSDPICSTVNDHLIKLREPGTHGCL